MVPVPVPEEEEEEEAAGRPREQDALYKRVSVLASLTPHLSSQRLTDRRGLEVLANFGGEEEKKNQIRDQRQRIRRRRRVYPPDSVGVRASVIKQKSESLLFSSTLGKKQKHYLIRG